MTLNPRYNATKIPYLFITSTPKLNFYDLGASINECLSFIKFLPRDILQFLNPEAFFKSTITNTYQGNYYISVLYNTDDFSSKYYDALNNQPFAIIFFEDLSNNICKWFIDLNIPFLITSTQENISDFLKKDDHFKNKFFESPTQFNLLFTDFLKQLIIEMNKYPEPLNTILTQLLIKQPKYALPDVLTIPNFRPSTSNYFLFGHKTGQIWKKQYKNKDVQKDPQRYKYISKGIIKLDNAISDELKNEPLRSMIKTKYDLPALIIIFPYINPNLDKNIDFSKMPADPLFDIQLIKRYVKGLKTQQNKEDYLFSFLKPDDFLNEKFPVFAEQAALSVVSKRLNELDNLAFLHSTFNFSASYKAPLLGKDYNQLITSFSPKEFSKRSKMSSILDSLHSFGNLLTSNVHHELIAHLKSKNRPVIGISDLPVEWLLIDDTPLFFTHDTCRIYETSHASIMAQYVKNSYFDFSVTTDILNKTLVVCLAPDDSMIASHFNIIEKVICDEQNIQGITFKTARSVKELSDLIKQIQPEFLILDTHGHPTSSSKDSDTVLQIGNDILTGNDIIKHNITAPLVLLACCYSSPLKDHLNPITQSFFEAGAFSVIATYLPVNVSKNSVLYTRIIGNLDSASKIPLHETWLNFISYNIRTSLFDDALERIKDYFNNNRIDFSFKTEIYTDVRSSWNIDVSVFSSRIKAFHNITDYIKQLFPVEYHQRISNLLSKKDYVPECYFYSILGRADLIKFDVWEKLKHHDQLS